MSKLTPAQQAALQQAIMKLSQNPVGNVAIIPLQNNSNYGLGSYTRFQSNLNIQPVAPFMLSLALLLFAITTLLSMMCAQGVAEAATVTPSPSAPVGSPSPTPSAVPAAWAAFEHAWTDITGYSTTVTLVERKDTQTQNSVFDYTFRKPASATVHYNQGTNAGVTVVWNGGDTVVAHRGSGLSALFTKKFGLHDSTVTTIRGSSIDQLSFAAILAHAQDTPGPTSQAVGPVISGVPTEAITLIPDSAVSNAGLTREVVDISTATNLPARVLGYDGDRLVRQVDFSNVKTER